MILLQIISLLFSIAIARHDAPAVSNFEFWGVTREQMKIFHGWNLALKVFFCLMAALIFYPDIVEMLFGFALSGLCIWLTFDPVLNRSRDRKRPWHYLGSNDADGRFWNGLFGKNSGKIKAAILAAALLVLNLLYLKLF